MQLILINAVHLNSRHHRLDQTHHALTHVAVQRIVGGECDNAVLPELMLDLEIRLAHFDERLCIVAACDDTSISVSE